MECVYAALVILFSGAVLSFFTKEKQKHLLFSILTLTALGTALHPAFLSIFTGNDSQLTLNHYLLTQKFIMIMDPFAAFLIVIIGLACLIYLLYSILTKNYKTDKWIPEFILSLLSSLIFVLCFHNGIYLCIGWFILNAIMLLYIKTYEQNSKMGLIKSLTLYLSSALFALTVILVGVFANGLNFPDFVKLLVNNNNYSNISFLLIFASCGLPILLFTNLISSSKRSEQSQFKEHLIIETIFYSICYYLLFRFIGMGAVPSFVPHCIILAFIAFVMLIKAYQLFKTTAIIKILSYFKSIQICLSVFFLMIGVLGYKYQVTMLMILGYSSSLMFLTNTILTKFATCFNIDKYLEVKDETVCKAELIAEKNFIKILPIGLLSFVGLPTTIGFWGWFFGFGALFYGITAGNTELRIISICAAVFISVILLSQIYKIFLVLRKQFVSNINTVKNSLPYFNLLWSLLIVIMGLFPKLSVNFIFVPASFFTGGTRFYEMYKSIIVTSYNISLYILIFTILLVGYIGIKTLILKYINSRTKV